MPNIGTGIPRFRTAWGSLRKAWSAAGPLAYLWAGLLLVQGLLPVAIVTTTKYVVDSLTPLLGVGIDDIDLITTAVGWTALLGALLLSTEFASALTGWVRVVLGERVSDFVRDEVHQKAATVDLAFYESPAYFDRLSRVLGEAGSRPLALLNGVGALAQHAVTLVAFLGVLIPYGLWLPAILLVSTLPALWVTVRYKRTHHAWWESRTQDTRRANYYSLVLTHSSAASEVRLFGLERVFAPAFRSLRKTLRQERSAIEGRQALGRLGAALVGLAAAGGAIAWVGVRAAQGLATLGDVVLFYQVFQRGQGLAKTLLGGLGQLYGDLLFLEHLVAFLTGETSVASPASPSAMPVVRHGLQFENVTFHYPDSDKPALTDFSLSLPAGRTVAIVGENGAGKSTFVKLIARFYDPDRGRVAIDGTDLRDLPLDELRRLVTVLFQFPVNFQASVVNTIAWGDPSTPPDRDRIVAAACAAGIHQTIEALPAGYDSQLGRWFENGQELSGGEWQRLAMARAFYRDAPILVLDEPTSMMDSWAEADWFDRFETLAQGRVAVVITHRLTIAQRADVIHVLHKGQVAESGTHAELLARGGRYHTSWVAQHSRGDGAAVPAPALAPPSFP